MSTDTVVIQGIVRPDGTLQLEEKIPFPAGRVSVTLQPIPYSEETDPLFLMLRRIREIRERGGVKPDAEAAQAALRRLRDDAAEEVAEVGRLQEECRRRKREAEGAGKEVE
jgi:hypothetical protein